MYVAKLHESMRHLHMLHVCMMHNAHINDAYIYMTLEPDEYVFESLLLDPDVCRYDACMYDAYINDP